VPSRFYSGFTRPASFGSRGFTFPSSGSGDSVDIDGTFEILSVPLDYVSERALSDNSTYDNRTFGSLGVTPGTYVWTWGSGATADSFTQHRARARTVQPCASGPAAGSRGLGGFGFEENTLINYESMKRAALLPSFFFGGDLNMT
jgi:hypothetical protein